MMIGSDAGSCCNIGYGAQGSDYVLKKAQASCDNGEIYIGHNQCVEYLSFIKYRSHTRRVSFPFTIVRAFQFGTTLASEMDKQRVLPPSVDEATLDAFFDSVSGKIGAANVSRDHSFGAPKGLHGQYSYGDPFPIARDHCPSGAVRPETVEEVRFVARAANRFKVPLWTVSRGKNLGYGPPD